MTCQEKFTISPNLKRPVQLSSTHLSNVRFPTSGSGDKFLAISIRDISIWCLFPPLLTRFHLWSGNLVLKKEDCLRRCDRVGRECMKRCSPLGSLGVFAEGFISGEVPAIAPFGALVRFSCTCKMDPNLVRLSFNLVNASLFCMARLNRMAGPSISAEFRPLWTRVSDLPGMIPERATLRPVWLVWSRSLPDSDPELRP